MKEALGSHLFEYFNMINMAQSDNHILKEESVIKKLNYFFKLNEMLATGVGKNYAILLGHLNDSMNKCYLYYSLEINTIVAQQGKNVLKFMTVKTMTMAKKGIIKVYTRML